jgi:hypothetical protein
MSVEGGPDIVTDGLVLHLDAANVRSYPLTGTAWADISRNGNNGTLTNGPTYTSSFGGGIVFDGTDDYNDCGNNPSIGSDIKRTITISTWFSLQQLNRVHTIIVKMQNSNVSRQYCFFVYDGNQSYFTNSDASGEQVFTSPTIFTSLNTPYHFTGTIDRTNRIVNQYVNGILVASSVNVIRQTDMVSLAEPLTVGGWGSGVRPKATIYSAQIYNRTLSAREVRQNYHATKGRYGLF